jgi:RimJ/RimL family protein N-acetyltransferase
MSDATNYFAAELLPNGRRIEIRAVKSSDRTDLAAALKRTSARSLYRRFFGLKRHFSEKEIDFFLNIDFYNHAALVAVTREGALRAIVGGGRYVVVRAGMAEVAFTVVDKFQGQGIGSLLVRHLARLARDAGLREFIAEVLPENTPMLKVFEKSGLQVTTIPEDGVIHVALRLL